MIPDILNIGSTIIDKIWPDAESAEAAKLKLLELNQKGELATIAASSKNIQAEAQSADKWTSRARPSFMYVFYALLVFCMIGSVVGIAYPHQAQLAASNFGMFFNGLPEELWWTFTAGYLGYTGARTYEKKKNVTR